MATQTHASLPISIRRIAVVGTTGSGKSTLAGALAARLHLPHIETDALNWQPDWRPASTEELRRRVDAATRANAWVIDGNYREVRGIIWSRAQAVVWLDYPLALILWRLWRRTWRRVLSKEHLWGTNYEELWPQLFSRDSLFLWALQTYWRRKKEYSALFADPEYAHLQFYHFTCSRQTKLWLDKVKPVSSREID
jgi:adenylate kinase family enzyme